MRMNNFHLIWMGKNMLRNETIQHGIIIFVLVTFYTLYGYQANNHKYMCIAKYIIERYFAALTDYDFLWTEIPRFY